jgi:hypothetical protein
MAITQLAIKYCDKLVANTSQRSIFFGSFVFGAAGASAAANFDATNTTRLIDALLGNVHGVNLSTQPLESDVRTELNLLINGGSQTIDGVLVTYPGLKNGRDKDNNPTTTESVVKATCAAALGSSAMLVQ